MKFLNKAHLYSVYFAPRGRERLLRIGEELAHIHISYRDRLIGIVGDTGSGKSLIVKGMFPGLTLTNDDDTINTRSVMQVRDGLDEDFKDSTYHIDIRFQMAFTQMYEIADFVKEALKRNRRVIVEHFDLLYPALGINADIIFGIGEEIIATRPNMFGPLPKDIYDIVFDSLKNRRMAHTAEDLTTLVLMKDYTTQFQLLNSDVRRGFVLKLFEKPDIDIKELEKKVKKQIDAKLPVSLYDESSIKIGDDVLRCTGPRIHVGNTGQIKNFILIDEFKKDPEDGMYALVGIINSTDYDKDDLNKIRKEVFS